MRNTASLRKPSRKRCGTPISIYKETEEAPKKLEKDPESMSRKELEAAVKDVQKRMKQAAAELNFEEAALLRDQMIVLKKHLQEIEE